MKRTKSQIAAYFYQPILYIIFGIIIIFILLLPYKDLTSTLKHLMFTNSGIVSESDNTASLFPSDREQSRTVYSEDITYPEYRQMFGRITCDNLGLDVRAYYGDSDEILNKGVGTNIGSGIPGSKTGVIIRGKNNSEFSVLQNITKGEIIHFATTYGFYQYN